MQVYTKKHLLEALKQAKLPYSYATMLEYERKGIISKPDGVADYGKLKWRFYTEVEIVQIVARVKEYRDTFKPS